MTEQVTPSQLIYSLWKAGHQSFERTTAVQRQLAAASAALNQAAAELPTAMARHLDMELPDAANKAANMIASKWTNANEHADRASQSYQQATVQARKVVYGATALMLIVITVAVVWLGMWIVPGRDEIARLRMEKIYLQATIAQLIERGGRATVYPCLDNTGRERLCVRIDETAKIAKGMRVIKGY